jgi:hypothetical protein
MLAHQSNVGFEVRSWNDRSQILLWE